jgi:hypothetical protein
MEQTKFTTSLSKAEWELPTDLNTVLSSSLEVEQPELGFIIGWNEPKRIHRPYVIISFFCYRIQLGYLY